MFKEGGREDRTSLTLNYFDVSRMNCFVVQRGRTGGQNIMDFELFDVSCMNYFDVQRGRTGGRNIMDFELL